MEIVCVCDGFNNAIETDDDFIPLICRQLLNFLSDKMLNAFLRNIDKAMAKKSDLHGI